MNKYLYFLLCPLTLIIISSCNKTNHEIIDKTISKLNSLRNIEFEQNILIQHKDMQMNKVDSARCFFDFKSSDTLFGAKYQIIHKEGEQVFNGVKKFRSNNKDENVIYFETPSLHEASSSIFMMNSIYVIKKLLPKMIVDTSIIFTRQNDIIINNQNCYSFTITMNNKWINPNIGYVISEIEKKTYNYSLKIYQNTYLPAQFEWIYPNEKGSWKSTFNILSLNSEKGDSIWGYQRFPKSFLRLSNNDFFETLKTKSSINVGHDAPFWTLPMIQGDSIKLEDLGELVLLEFWFPYCKGCVQAVPVLNQIQKEYQNKRLKIFGIEFTQIDKEVLKEYIKTQKIEYPTLYKGKQVSKKYGINAAPTFFLINKKGIIIYTSKGLNKDELINVIEKNLQ